MTVEEIEERILKYTRESKKMFVTSSFQTHSIPLLHIISKINARVDVLFINTGFHFAESLEFRDKIAQLLNLNVINVRSSMSKNMQRDEFNQFYFTSDPDYCCHINKVQPLEPYLMQYDIWINGIRGDQSATRKAMDIEQAAPHGAVRFHPMLDWNSKMIFDYRKKYNLPAHPLEEKGYLSIGCEPCTRKFDITDERSARWFGLNKTECGLHTELTSK